MSTFTAIDLSRLPPPNVVEPLDFESILAERKAALVALHPPEQQAAIASTLALESEPLTKHLQENAYRELLLRQRINSAAKAVMLSYAQKEDLDQLGALFGVLRLQIAPGDPMYGIAPTMEPDEDYRRRIQLSLEGFSTAGPEGAYIFHALSADGQVLDASATSPVEGKVLVSVLSRTGDGTASQPLLDKVDAVVSADDTRPLTDWVVVQSAQILPYQIDATLFMFSGPSSDVVMANARAAVEEYVAESHRLGRDITLSGIYAALHQPGVQRVLLTGPVADIVVTRTQAAYCTGINLTMGGLGE
ncbi:baseplate assembly protein [Oceanisphaera sp. KMM 10153]|uniref:baseplate assembly protein n=1 Tax=Oceanisphaera submarina TaxID=3390193 RepID=UPI003975F8B9